MTDERLKEYSFDPADDEMWRMGSDVDWIRGDYVCGLKHPGQFAQEYPWLVANRLFAETMVKANAEMVKSIIGALISWRVCTIRQLRAGLSVVPVPDFQRDEPNLYGALCRLGVINIGFDMRERFEHITLPEVWVSIGNKQQPIIDALRLLDPGDWLRKLMSSTRLYNARPHARHNTFASHVGVSLLADERVKMVGGDGWGSFRLIDRQAVAESGLNHISSTDLVALCDNNLMAGIEVQGQRVNMEVKVANWTKLLSYSPMQRRGLLCIWLLIRKAGVGVYPAFTNLIERTRQMGEMMVGDPTVASRMGIAYWDDWFDHGKPTGRLGEYTDMFGTQRSMFDPKWKEYTPTPRPFSTLENWGWQVMRDAIREHWGWDASGWVMPEALRGNFYGFSKGDDE